MSDIFELNPPKTNKMEEFRQPHPKIRPLHEQNAPPNCKLACILDEAFFQDTDGNWILYYKDGRFINTKSD